ncbi:MAG TPA: lytic transglycosylase domain-containing protein [Gaiellaceae bacterium]|nr:lytic transglycosylase domain-containing protein [Gaiellaceae bacterium]
MRLRPAAICVLALAAVLVGCGGSQGARAVSEPAALAAEIDSAQATIDDSSASAVSVAKASRAQQLALEELAEHRRLRLPTLTQLSAPARTATAAALRAGDELGRILPAEHRFPRWRILSPPPPSVLLRYFEQAQARYGVAWRYLAAIELVETRMGRIHGRSPAGARGPMQFMPATWAEYGQGSIESPHDSIMAAARFLAANGGRGDIGEALLHYNPSHSYVVAVESYAREMRTNARAFYGYYNWQVFYRTAKGTFVLPVGYPRVRPQGLPG